MKQMLLSRSVVAAMASLLLAMPLLAGTTHTVEIQVGGFSPNNVTLEVGDRVLWVNVSGVAHNVVAGDGSFNSGIPSPDSWNWGRFFSSSGIFTYSSQGAGGFTGTVTVAGVFGDGLEAGTTSNWTTTEPSFPSCNCYFSNDCSGVNNFCNWGSLTVEDSCEWMENKPNSVPGAGCDVLFLGTTWQGGICDGVCSPSSFGSIPGSEDKALVSEAIALWSMAVLEPSKKPGGGPVDPVQAQKALNLPFVHEDSAIQIGRQVADLMMLSGVPEFYDHFCHYEAHPNEPNPELWVDLSAQRCRAALVEVLTRALGAEVVSPGAGAAVLAERPAVCMGLPDQLGGTRCAGDPQCLAARVASLAVLLTTPPNLGNSLQKTLANNAPH